MRISNSVLTGSLINDLNLTGKNILLTGASGVIGRQWIEFFNFAENLGIIPNRVVASSSTGSFSSDLRLPKSLEVLSGDITTSNLFENVADFDLIIHGAGYGQPGRFLADPESTILINTSVVHSLLGKLAPRGMFVFLSTSEIYTGSPSNLPSEQDHGISLSSDLRATYVESKKLGEAILYSEYRRKNLDFRIFRVGLAYGPGFRDNDQRVLSEFFRKAISELAINLLDDGGATRRYIFSEDAVILMALAMSRGNPGVYNIGGIEETSIINLAQLIAGFYDVPIKTNVNHAKEERIKGAPKSVGMDVQKVLKLLNSNKFEFTNLSEGIEIIAKWIAKVNLYSEIQVEKSI